VEAGIAGRAETQDDHGKAKRDDREEPGQPLAPAR
jgi:hypothetical protein